MKKALIIIAIALFAAVVFAQATHGSTAIFTKEKSTVEKFEDRAAKTTCYILMNGKSGQAISCVK